MIIKPSWRVEVRDGEDGTIIVKCSTLTEFEAWEKAAELSKKYRRPAHVFKHLGHVTYAFVEEGPEEPSAAELANPQTIHTA